jgi:hypothetical protein
MLPANLSLLRGFASVDPRGLSSGPFCWNGECKNSTFYFRLPGETVERRARACRYRVREGMEITVVTPELARALRGILERAESEAGTDASGASTPSARGAR